MQKYGTKQLIEFNNPIRFYENIDNDQLNKLAEV